MTNKAQCDAAVHLQDSDEANHNSLDQMWTLAETTFVAVFLFSNGICSKQNQMAEQIFGYSQEEAIGKSLDHWIVAKDRAIVAEKLFGPEGCWVNKITALRKDGSTFSTAIRACTIQHAGQQIRMINLYDSSSQRLLETLVCEQKQHSNSLNDVIKILHPFTEKVPFLEFLDIVGPLTNACEALIALGDFQSLTVMARWSEGESLFDEGGQKDQPIKFGIPSSQWEILEESCIEASGGEIEKALPGYFSKVKGPKSVLLIPIISVNGLIGVLGFVVGKAEKEWKIYEKEFLRTATNYLAYAIDRNQKELDILLSLKEKDVLLREIHHRVKNNMQIISSLLSLQARRIGTPEVAAAIDESQNRIYSMSLIHEMLYQSSDMSAINAENYLNRLVGYLANVYRHSDDAISWQVQSEPILLAIDDAIPLGLIVNELVTNSFEHGFKGLSEGVLKVILRRIEVGSLELLVDDDGHGIPQDSSFESATTMGMQMVNDLACSQLDGKLSINRAKGTCVHFQFTTENCGKAEA